MAKLGAETKSLEDKVSTFKDKEATLVVLKNRISVISQLINKVNIQSAMFNLVTEKLPTSATITSISVDRARNVLISLLLPNSSALEQTLSNLAGDDVFEKVNKIDIEGLSIGKDQIYRINLKLLTKNQG